MEEIKSSHGKTLKEIIEDKITDIELEKDTISQRIIKYILDVFEEMDSIDMGGVNIRLLNKKLVDRDNEVIVELSEFVITNKKFVSGVFSIVSDYFKERNCCGVVTGTDDDGNLIDILVWINCFL